VDVEDCGYRVDAGVPTGGAQAAGGWLHSVDAGSAVDGPGMRLVLFLAGCPLRCSFCHNPDTWRSTAGKRITLEEAVALVGRYAAFLRGCNGGVTLSGGEPLAQWKFARELARAIKAAHGLHVTVQTSGFRGDRVLDADFELVDLWMVDVKAAEAGSYRRVTGVEQGDVLGFLGRLSAAGRPVWASYVLIPGVTDSDAALDDLARLLVPMGNVQRLELRPFHQLGRRKWEELGLEYPLVNTPVPSAEQLMRAAALLRNHGLEVVVG
jgi:pyruvate formate lyase activating enzyme